MSISRRLKSFTFAFNGLYSYLRSEPNGRIHLAATIVTVGMAIWLHCSSTEWAILILAITIVWITEMLNTAIEKAMDHVSPEIHPQVKIVKDVAAGAVLVAAITAVIIGGFIFLPKLMA